MIKLFNNSFEDEDVIEAFNFEIKKDIVENSTETYYYLLASTANANVKIATELTLKADNSFAANLSSDSSRFISIGSCSGCDKGCEPKRWRDSDDDINWMCTPCTQGKQNCTKSVTQTRDEL